MLPLESQRDWKLGTRVTFASDTARKWIEFWGRKCSYVQALYVVLAHTNMQNTISKFLINKITTTSRWSMAWLSYCAVC